MAWRPKTIFGKILKGVTIGAAGVAAVAAIAATGGTAAPAVTAGTGFFGKLIGVTAKAASQVGKGVSAVAKGAANLVSGVTAEQRKMIKEQKAETKTGIQVLTTIKKLIGAGATVEEAASKVGVPMSELKGSFGIPSDAEAAKAELTQVIPVTAGQGCAGTAAVLLIIGISATILLSFVIF